MQTIRLGTPFFRFNFVKQKITITTFILLMKMSAKSGAGSSGGGGAASPPSEPLASENLLTKDQIMSAVPPNKLLLRYNPARCRQCVLDEVYDCGHPKHEKISILEAISEDDPTDQLLSNEIWVRVEGDKTWYKCTSFFFIGSWLSLGERVNKMYVREYYDSHGRKWQKALKKYTGKLDQLMQKLVKEYGPEEKHKSSILNLVVEFLIKGKEYDLDNPTFDFQVGEWLSREDVEEIVLQHVPLGR